MIHHMPTESAAVHRARLGEQGLWQMRDMPAIREPERRRRRVELVETVRRVVRAPREQGRLYDRDLERLLRTARELSPVNVPNVRDRGRQTQHVYLRGLAMVNAIKRAKAEKDQRGEAGR